jgi:hypothetical protein
LVRLSDGQIKAEKEAFIRADELYHKHIKLQKDEQALTKKF